MIIQVPPFEAKYIKSLRDKINEATLSSKLYIKNFLEENEDEIMNKLNNYKFNFDGEKISLMELFNLILKKWKIIN